MKIENMLQQENYRRIKTKTELMQKQSGKYKNNENVLSER